MKKLVDTRLLWKAAQLTREWHDEDLKDRVREEFAKFAMPYWREWYPWPGGAEAMVKKYVQNDDQSIFEYLYNLDEQNKELVTRYLLGKAKGWPEKQWTIEIEEE